MSTLYILIVFGIVEFTVIVGGFLISKSFERYFHELLPAYKEMVTLINEKDEAREKVYKAQLAVFDTMVRISTTTNEQYEIIIKQYDTMSKAFENMIQMCDQLIDYEKTLNAHYYTLEERYSQIYDQFDECHKQLNDIRMLIEPKEEDENDDGWV